MAKEISSLIDHCKTHGLTAIKATVGMLAELWSDDSLFCQQYKIESDALVKRWFTENPMLAKDLYNANLEDQAYLSSSLYSNLLAEDEQSKLCCYFTPPFLANRLIKQIIVQNPAKFKHGRIADLSAGGGAFLLPVAISLLDIWRKENPITQLKKLESTLVGVDICQELLDLCGLYLYRLCFDLIAKTNYVPKWQLHCQNALDIDNIGNIDIVLCNPPYRKLSIEEHREFKPSYQFVMNGNSNLYALFIQQALNLSNDNAVLGFVTPSSLLTGAHFQNTRNFITRNAKIMSIYLMEGRNKYFSFVLQETILFCIDKGRTKPIATKLFEIDSNGGEKCLGSISISVGKDAWICHRTVAQQDISQLIHNKTHDLNSLGFTVNIGSYVWNRDPSEKMMDIPPQHMQSAYFPVVYPEMITEIAIDLDKFRERTNKARWIKPHGKKLLKDIPSLILKRTRTSSGAHTLTSALIDTAFIARYKSYVPENHVIYITHESNSLEALKTLGQILSGTVMGNLHACVNSTNSISKSSLLSLPMPSRKVFNQLLENNFCDRQLLKELEQQ